MLNQTKNIFFLIVLLSSHLVIGQTVRDVFLGLPDTFLIDYGLPFLTVEERSFLLEGESVSMGEAGNIRIEQHDTINQLLGISFSENFDESGYTLWMGLKFQKKNRHLVFALQEGDHCCDWIVKLGGAIYKKGQWEQMDSLKYWPEISWATFYDDLSFETKYDFLGNKPEFTIYPKDGGFEIELSYDLIAMGYEFGEEFLTGDGKKPRKIFLIWNNQKGRFETYYYERTN